MPNDEKLVYLTFDDGPTPEVTDYVLDVLNQYNFKATFFCIGKNVVEEDQVYRRIIDEGHSVGNHTFNHVKGFSSGNYAYYADVLKAEEHIQSTLFRPPYGKILPRQSHTLSSKFDIVMWSILSGDFDPELDTDYALNRMQELTQSGSIIVFHDSVKAAKNLKELLPPYLKFLNDNGYTSCGL